MGSPRGAVSLWAAETLSARTLVGREGALLDGRSHREEPLDFPEGRFAIAGIWGAILSIPVAAAIRVIYLYHRERETSTDELSDSVEPLAEKA